MVIQIPIGDVRACQESEESDEFLCPHCSEELSYVHYDYTETGYCTTYPSGDNDDDNFSNITHEGDYTCPYCGEDLSGEDLSGKDIWILGLNR